MLKGLCRTLKWCCRCSCWGRSSATGGHTSQGRAWSRWRAATCCGRHSPLHWHTSPRERDTAWERWRWSERAPAGSRETAWAKMTVEASCPPPRSPTILQPTFWKETQKFYITEGHSNMYNNLFSGSVYFIFILFYIFKLWLFYITTVWIEHVFFCCFIRVLFMHSHKVTPHTIIIFKFASKTQKNWSPEVKKKLPTICPLLLLRGTTWTVSPREVASLGEETTSNSVRLCSTILSSFLISVKPEPAENLWGKLRRKQFQSGRPHF